MLTKSVIVKKLYTTYQSKKQLAILSTLIAGGLEIALIGAGTQAAHTGIIAN
jgi:hypothetical protein